MQPPVRAMDVCVHLPTGRRCLAVAPRPGGAVECVDTADRPFVCREDELVTYRHPGFDEAVGRDDPVRR